MTEQQSTEPVDPLADVKVGDPVTESMVNDDGPCGRMIVGQDENGVGTTYGCTRDPSHPGRCIATTLELVVAVSA